MHRTSLAPKMRNENKKTHENGIGRCRNGIDKNRLVHVCILGEKNYIDYTNGRIEIQERERLLLQGIGNREVPMISTLKWFTNI
jgi:hypothetical protein